MNRDIVANNDPAYQSGYQDGFTARARQPVAGVVMPVGKLTLHRLRNNQLYLTDGVVGVAVDETRLETLLRHVFENRWHPAHLLREEIEPPLPAQQEMVS